MKESAGMEEESEKTKPWHSFYNGLSDICTLVAWKRLLYFIALQQRCFGKMVVWIRRVLVKHLRSLKILYKGSTLEYFDLCHDLCQSFYNVWLVLVTNQKGCVSSIKK